MSNQAAHLPRHGEGTRIIELHNVPLDDWIQLIQEKTVTDDEEWERKETKLRLLKPDCRE